MHTHHVHIFHHIVLAVAIAACAGVIAGATHNRNDRPSGVVLTAHPIVTVGR